MAKGIEPWEILQQESLFYCPVFEIHKKKARSVVSGNQHNFFIVHHGRWVNVIPITAKKEIVLVRQYRLGTEDFSIEIPGGLVEMDEDPEDAARRELLEETGYGGGRLSFLGHIQPNPATHDNLCYAYLIEDVELIQSQHLDPNEEVEVIVEPLEHFLERVKRGEVKHALVLSALLMYQMQH